MKNVKYFFDVFKKLNIILNKKQKLRWIKILFWMLISSVFELLGVSIMIPFIEMILDQDRLLDNSYISWIADKMQISSYMGYFAILVLGVILVYIIKNLLLIYSRAVQTRFQCQIEEELSLFMMESYMDRPYSYYAKTNSSDIRQGTIDDVYNIYVIIQTVCQLAAESITVLFIVAYIVYMDWIMAVGVTLVAGILIIVLTLCLKSILKRSGEQFRKTDIERNKGIMQISQGIKDIFVMQRKKYFYDAFKKSYDEYKVAKGNYFIIKEVPERIIETAFVMDILILVLLRIGGGADAAKLIPNLGALVMAAYRLLPSANKFSNFLNSIIFYNPSLNAAYENICEAKKIQHAENGQKRTKEGNILSYKNSISIQNITWKYDASGTKIFDDASLEIRKGDSVAIIGESGSGKTTLADMILGLYRPIKGTILVDGQDIYPFPEQWSRIISYVPQTVYLLDDTVRANILFGCVATDEEKIWDALEQAQLKEFVWNLPDKLDTVVGEAGVRFSGGQRQRIAIARALYSSPDILLLDEATAALDNDTEGAVMEAIDSLKGKKTLIIIAHRLSTIKNCNRVYEVKNGSIIDVTNNFASGRDGKV